MSANNNSQTKDNLTTLEIVSAFFPFVWSTKAFSIKCRLVFSLLLVVVTIGLNLGVPIIFKQAVNIIPALLEVLLAFVILWYLYSLSYGLLVLSVLGLFLLITIITSNYAAKYQQAFNKIDMRVSARIVDSLLNVDTVKLFNNQAFE